MSMYSLKNKEAKFCQNCKWVQMFKERHGDPEYPQCKHPVLLDASGALGPTISYARKNPDLCGEIGRYWENKL